MKFEELNFSSGKLLVGLLVAGLIYTLSRALGVVCGGAQVGLEVFFAS